jgi:hypothetical protein
MMLEERKKYGLEETESLLHTHTHTSWKELAYAERIIAGCSETPYRRGNLTCKKGYNRIHKLKLALVCSKGTIG